MVRLLIRLLVGKPFETARLKHEKLGKVSGLAVFAADGLSSVAYATEEIVLALVVAGTAGLEKGLIPVSIGIVALIFIVAMSYRQTVMEYPSGGGAYIVARENLGPVVAQVAGAALLTDYILTVAVSVSSGVAAITSAVPTLHPYRALIGVACVVFICLANLRGVRESAAVFAGPVYLFIGSMLGLVGVGLYRQFVSHQLAPPWPADAPNPTQMLGWFLLLRAFASGCAALTGIEAIANGIQAFREPASKNAATVLAWLAALLAMMFIGTSYLAQHYHIIVNETSTETVVSQIARLSTGNGSVFYYVIQAATAVILILAANTSFADFPRLASFQARDGYLPRQLSNLGDRLVYSNGILVLTFVSSLLIVIFKGDTHKLIPLYAVGVFTAFTLSQTGMVLHWLRLRNTSHWHVSAVINGIGALTTAVVVVVVAVMKFSHGAWIVIILIPAMVTIFLRIHSHYLKVANALSLQGRMPAAPQRSLVLVLAGGLHRGLLTVLQYAKALGAEVRAIHVEVEGHEDPRIQRQWKEYVQDLDLVVLESPFRELAQPVRQYVQKVRAEEGYDFVLVVVPEFVVGSWWESLLHNHSALFLQWALADEPSALVVVVRYRLADLLASQNAPAPPPNDEETTVDEDGELVD